MNEQDSIIREINDVMSDLLEYHFKGEKALPTDLIKQYERLIEADKLIKDYEYPEKIDKLKALQKRFSISLQQARKDMIQATELFNRIEFVDLNSSFRLLLEKVRKYENLCYKTNSIKDARHYLQLELDILMKIKDSLDDLPASFSPTINIYTSGDEAATNLILADRKTDKVKQLIMSLPIDDETKEKELNAIGITLRK